MSHWAIYVRRSWKAANSADVSDEMQEATAKKQLPADATYEVIRDSGGHNSGRTDERVGYQELLGKVRAGIVHGIAIYDLSRLARKASLMLPLRDELEHRQVHLLVATMPNTKFDTAIGRYIFGQLCLAAQLQADLDSERMTAMLRRIFEGGGHRGHDPFGYRSARDEHGRMAYPRQLEVVPEEATVIRRLWELLRSLSYSEIADLFNREGVEHRKQRSWTRDAVKDITRRGRVYLGYVVHKRGLEERPGRHVPILDEETYRSGIAAVGSRKRAGRKPKPYRHYLLRGLIHCSCGTRMWGVAHVQRGGERRYYRCRNVACHARQVPAERAEKVVLEAIGQARLSTTVIEAAREEVRQRLRGPQDSLHEKQRRRLLTRVDNLKKQFGWGDIVEAEYLAEMRKARQALAMLPDKDKLVLFDRNRKVLTDMAANIGIATPVRREELARLLVERVDAQDAVVQAHAITWTPPAKPFFALAAMRLECPQGDSNP